MLDPAERLVGVHVADDDQRGVVGDVVAPVVAVQIVARHRLQIGEPADRRVAVRMRFERGRDDFLIEELIGVVFTAVQLRDDHGAFRFAIVRMVQAVRHPLGLDEEHPIERVFGRRLEIRCLIDPGVAVPTAAELLDDAFDLIARDVGGALEIHVLDPVRHAGQARALVLRADLVPAPHRRQRRGVLLLNEHLQTVVESRAAQHQIIIKSMDTHARVEKHRQPAAHRVPDESGPANERTRHARALGRPGSLRADSRAPQGRAEVRAARRSALRQRQHPHGHGDEQDPEGSRRQVALHGRLRCAVRRRLRLPRPADRAESRSRARAQEARDVGRRLLPRVPRLRRALRRRRCRSSFSGSASSAPGTSRT